MSFTIPQIIEISKVSQYLANDAAANGSLYTPVIDPLLGIKLYVIRKDVEDVYSYDHNYDGLVETSNYLYGLCGMYALTAWAIITGGTGGGSVTPVTPSSSTQYLEFIVAADTRIPTGGSIAIFNTAPYDYRGFNLIFNRNNIPQGQINNGGAYFNWNSTSGAFQCFPDASEGEDFQFYVTV